MFWTREIQVHSGKKARRHAGTKGNAILSAAVLVAAGLTGCTHRQNSAPVETVPPVQADEAMQKRDWPQVNAVYTNGSVAAGPTEFNYEPKRHMKEWKYVYADSGTFFVNSILLPYNLLKHPQTETVVVPGETIPPSYTAQPVLPPQLVFQPSTPPVNEEQGAQPTTPKVGDPGAMEPPAPAPSNESAPPAQPSTPAPSNESTPPAPSPSAQQMTPAPPAPSTEAPPAPPPSPQMAPAPQPAPEPAPAPGEVAPTTPRVIEPPPPQATRNLAPPIHVESQPAPSTQPVMNK